MPNIKYFDVTIEYSASDIERLVVKAESIEKVKEIFSKNKMRYRDVTIKERAFRDITGDYP